MSGQRILSWDERAETFPCIGTSTRFDDLMEASQPKGIISMQTVKENHSLPGLEKGSGNLLDKRPRTFGDRLMATLSEETRFPRDEKTGQDIAVKYIPRDSKTEGREL